MSQQLGSQQEEGFNPPRSQFFMCSKTNFSKPLIAKKQGVFSVSTPHPGPTDKFIIPPPPPSPG